MYRLLDGLRVVECASFIAGPSCGLHLAQMGAEVVRIDAIGGGPDFRRFPRAPNGSSLYWEGLNKGKKSVALDLGKPEGRELALAIATAPGPGSGLFLTNFPVDSFLAHAKLAARRKAMITLRIMGWADGRTALDYTVNSALGIPLMTGPDSLGDQPVNHVLPAWDLAAGLYAAFAMLAAEHRRTMTGQGEEIRVPLGDIAMASLGHLGQIAEVTLGGDRKRYGNDLYGAFGRDFPTADGRRVVIIALTRRHWLDLVKTLGISDRISEIERELRLDFGSDEGLRFEHRNRLNPIVAEAVTRHSAAELATLFEGTGVCWGDYKTLREAVGDKQLISAANPIFSMVEHVSGATYLTPGAAATLTGSERHDAVRAPRIGENTDEVLAKVLGLSDGQIGALHDAGAVAGPDGTPA